MAAKVATTQMWVELPARPGSGKKRKTMEDDADEQDAPRKEAKKKSRKGTTAAAVSSVGAAKVASKEFISDSEDEAKEPASKSTPAPVRIIAAPEMQEEVSSSHGQTLPAVRGTPRKGAAVKVCSFTNFTRTYTDSLFRKMRPQTATGKLSSATLSNPRLPSRA